MDCGHPEIDKAKTEQEVLQSATDYLNLWAPRELEPLALGLVDLRIESPDDIERVKRWLIDSKASPYETSPHGAHLRELAGYFWHASTRIGEIRNAH
jgi:hypothetical protein